MDKKYETPADGHNLRRPKLFDMTFRPMVQVGAGVAFKVGKRFSIGERANVEFRMTMFDVLNHTNWRLGGWTGNVNNITAFTGTFGQMLNGWAYQDPNGSNDPGGRITDFMVRINF